MKNPFRTEADAYRFVIGTALYFAAIGIASAFGGRWWGLGVFVAVSLPAVAWFFRAQPRGRPAVTMPGRRTAPGERRILVIANETVAGGALRDAIRAAAGDGKASVLVVAPALNSPLRHWTSDEDAARSDAGGRLDRSVSELGRLGFSVRGEIGDADPLQAIEDALRSFGADEIVISTHPEGRSNWLEHGVVRGARERFALPVTHVVVDLDAEASRPAS